MKAGAVLLAILKEESEIPIIHVILFPYNKSD